MTKAVEAWILFVWADDQWTPIKGFPREDDAREDAKRHHLPTHIARVRVQLPGAPVVRP